MKVSEVISELKRHDPDSEVLCFEREQAKDAGFLDIHFIDGCDYWMDRPIMMYCKKSKRE